MKEQKKSPPADPKKRSGSFDKAVADYEKAMKLFHKRDFAGAKAHFEDVVGKHDGEIEVCERAAIYARICEEQIAPKKPRPKSADDHYLLGVLEHNGGEYGSAIAQFHKALDLAPSDDRYRYALAASHARAGQSDEAMKALTAAVSANEENRILAALDEDFDGLEDDERFINLTRAEPAGDRSGAGA
ncbi:MAG: tetratricopeptide repeat protein [Acidobacteriota bacterium]